jgi:Rrf2 family protein
MIYSKTSEYAIRALAYLSTLPKDTVSTFKEAAQHTGVPQAYVAKIFQCLVRSKILGSHRGRIGGFYLKVDPAKLTLMRVINSIEDVSHSIFTGCVMGLDQCSDRHPCPLHHEWVEAKERMAKRLLDTTIADVAKLEGRFEVSKKKQPYSLSKGMRKLFNL